MQLSLEFDYIYLKHFSITGGTEDVQLKSYNLIKADHPEVSRGYVYTTENI